MEICYQHFVAARKLGTKEYLKNTYKGKSGNLPFLEGLLKNAEIVSEVDLGIVEVPLNKVVGTYTYSRSTSFACNFMPLLTLHTEFGEKWVRLCEAHLSEGIRDPIKVYEYLNRFYVVEGNKRVSVLKYFDAYSIRAKVTRLIPKFDAQDLKIRIYYEFIKFNKKTGINCIWFTREASFSVLGQYLDSYRPVGTLITDKYENFVYSIYLPFRKVYHELGGGKLAITTGDAFLEFVKVFGIPGDIPEEEVKVKLKPFIKELKYISGQKTAEIQMKPDDEHEHRLISSISALVKPSAKIKVAFVYAKPVQYSNWSFSHDSGRRYIDEVLRGKVETSYIENVPETPEAYQYLKGLAEKGIDAVFATSPAFLNASLKAAIEYPHVKFFNCSEANSFKHVNTYFGRIYEPRFLAGIIAGAMTGTDILGYVGTHPVPGVISGINAFALGAMFVNPHIKVKVEWTNQWDCGENAGSASTLLIQAGADFVCHHNTMSGSGISKEFGVYSMICSVDKGSCTPDEYITAPVWNWGVFYERIIRSLLNGTVNAITGLFGSSEKLINFWWGIDSGIVDIFYSKTLVPLETQKLVELMKKNIASGEYHPFTGPVYDRKGILRIKDDEAAGHDQILSMDWFVNAVESNQ